ncbi:MAG: PDZ domain-containing protein [bacterium]|jgi:serine protease Do
MKSIVSVGLAVALGTAGAATAGEVVVPGTDGNRQTRSVVIWADGENWDLSSGELQAPLEIAALTGPALLAYMQNEGPAPPPPEAPQVHVFTNLYRSRSYLGIGVAEIDSERAKALNLSEERGVEISRVMENTPASEAGLQEGDVVTEYNGTPVQGVEQFVRLVRETPPGRKVTLAIVRNGQPQTVVATMGTRRGAGEWESELRRNLDRLQQSLRNQRFEFDMPPVFVAWPARRLGVEAEPLTPQLAEFFGVKQGVLVRSVNKGSPAEKAGIEAGDIITKVKGEEVATAGEISRALRRVEPNQTVPLTVVRNRSEMTLQVILEAPEEPAFGGPGRIRRRAAPPAPQADRPVRPVAAPGPQAL